MLAFYLAVANALGFNNISISELPYIIYVCNITLFMFVLLNKESVT